MFLQYRCSGCIRGCTIVTMGTVPGMIYTLILLKQYQSPGPQIDSALRLFQACVGELPEHVVERISRIYLWYIKLTPCFIYSNPCACERLPRGPPRPMFDKLNTFKFFTIGLSGMCRYYSRATSDRNYFTIFIMSVTTI